MKKALQRHILVFFLILLTLNLYSQANQGMMGGNMAQKRVFRHLAFYNLTLHDFFVIY